MHMCKELSSFEGSEAVKIKIEKRDSEWFLIYAAYATDYDVKAGEAETAGEEMGEVAIKINYCPYCGKAL